VIFMPLVGTAILGAASHLPPADWRVGSTFFVCAACRRSAIGVALHYFKQNRILAKAGI
jgi:DHA1 family tetracycline resistance protein-like MFS transporter